MTGIARAEVPDVGRYVGLWACPVGTALFVAVASLSLGASGWAQPESDDLPLIVTPEDCARIAGADSLQVRAAWRRFLDATRGIDVAKAGRIGALGVTGSISRQIPSVSIPVGEENGAGVGGAISFPDETKEVHVVGGQPIFDGGLAALNTTLARIDRQAAASQFRQVQGVAALNAYEAAYRVLRAKQMLRVALFAVTSYMEHLRTASERFAGMTVSRLDVAAAEAQVAQARQALASAEAEIERAETELKTILDVDLDRTVDVREGADLQPPDLAVEDMARIGVAFREDFDAVLRGVQRTAGEAYYPVVADLPRVEGFADYRHGTSFFSLPKDQFTIGFQGSFSLFDGGLGKAERRQYRERLEAAKLDAEYQGRVVTEQVAMAYTAVEEQEQILESAGVAERAARTELEIASLRYAEEMDVGGVVLDAQARVAAGQSAVVNGQYEYNLANVRMLLAMGVIGAHRVGSVELHPDLMIHVYDRRGVGRAAIWWTGDGEARLVLNTRRERLKVRPLAERERILEGANARFKVTDEPVRVTAAKADGPRLYELLSGARVETIDAGEPQGRP